MIGPLNTSNPLYTPNIDINPSSKNNIASLGNSNFIPPNYQNANSSNNNSIALFKIPSSATNSLYVDGKTKSNKKTSFGLFYFNTSIFYD